MPSHDLIRNHRGAELPAPGHWAIVRGQRLVAVRRRWPWPQRFDVGVTGLLRSAEHDPALTLELSLDLPGPDRAAPSARIRTSARLVTADRLDRWQFAGTATIDGESLHHLDLRIAYRGVHARGAAPVTWLRLMAAVPDPARPRARPLVLAGDLNAVLQSQAGSAAVDRGSTGRGRPAA